MIGEHIAVGIVGDRTGGIVATTCCCCCCVDGVAFDVHACGCPAVVEHISELVVVGSDSLLSVHFEGFVIAVC